MSIPAQSILMGILCQVEVGTVRRGHEVRQHILFKAKDVFLEAGFERASMDVIAARAETTKRTLYAHFENKEQLFLAVTDLVRDLLRAKLKTPAEFADDPTEALVLFFTRFQKILAWGPAVRMCRLGITEAERFPEGSTRIYEAVFGTAQEHTERFLHERLGLSLQQSLQISNDLLSRVLYPNLARVMFGVERVSDEWLEDDYTDAAVIRNYIAQMVPPQ